MNFLPGDLILVDSNKTGPKIVKFFMTAPNAYIHLWRKIRGNQEKVNYYHVAMILNDHEIIEQQGEVEIAPLEKTLNKNENLLFVRYKNTTPDQRARCASIAKADLGEKWDVLNAIGKFITWLTAIPLFARYIQKPEDEICVCRVGLWWRNAFGEKFGVKDHSELTTHKMYNYIMSHLDKFEIVYAQGADEGRV